MFADLEAQKARLLSAEHEILHEIAEEKRKVMEEQKLFRETTQMETQLKLVIQTLIETYTSRSKRLITSLEELLNILL